MAVFHYISSRGSQVVMGREPAIPVMGREPAWPSNTSTLISASSSFCIDPSKCNWKYWVDERVEESGRWARERNSSSWNV